MPPNLARRAPRSHHFLLATLGLAVGATLATPAEPSELEGVWLEQVYVPTREEHPGKVRIREPMTLVVTGHQFDWKRGDRSERQSLAQFVPGQTPKAINLMTVSGDEFWLSRAIYQIDGDTLTICEAVHDKPRPTAFRRWEGAQDQNLTVLTTFKRRSLPRVKVGQIAPAIDGLLADGSPLDPKDLAGKLVLLTFWSADDDARERQFAALRAIRKEFRADDRLRIVTVRLGGEWDAWLALCARPLDPAAGPHPSFDCDPTWWQVFHTPHAETRHNPFGAGTGPEAYLVGPEGKVAAVRLPDDKLRDAVAGLLNADR